MLPYIDIPPLKLGPLTIHPFGVLVATAVLTGSWLANKRTRHMGLREEVTEGAAGYAVVIGFITAHLYSAIFYFPERIADNPLYLLKIWDGISSFGGFVGGLCGALYFYRREKVSAWAYGDAIIYGWSVAWIFGRLGCTVAFDHPGSITDFVLGMKYPGDSGLAAGVRHNLGFYEAIWAVGVSLLFWTQRNKKHFYGWFMAVYGILYTPFRFSLDFWRAVDKRYFGLTPGQYAAIVLFGLAVWIFVKRSKSGVGEPWDAEFSPKEQAAAKKRAEKLAKAAGAPVGA